MSKKLIVSIDYDDVLFPLLSPWVDAINNTYDTNVSAEDITDWDIQKFFPTLSREQIFAPLKEDAFWEKLEPSEQALFFIPELIKDGHRLKIVTNTHYKNVRVKMKRLFECFPYITWDDVTITSDKQSIICDVMIDDNPDNLKDGNYHKILLNMPHNAHYDAEKDGMFRVYNFRKAYGEISKLSQKKCQYYGSYLSYDWKHCLCCKHGSENDGAQYCGINGNGEYQDYEE